MCNENEHINFEDIELKKDYFKTITNNKSNNVDISFNNTDDLNYENEINEQFVEDLKTFRNNL
jgi:hypothetical protein